jgi:sulfate adenylyltransferase subunit 1
MSAIEKLPAETLPDNGLLRFLTCGSVDDGKSTLIGRLLFDSKTILADTLHAIQRTSAKRGLDVVDLSLLTDGLQAEREQGITIDVAYRYFTTGTRKYIIADAPGHEQYTRNMVTAASTADLAIILIDARKGVLTQTRRHSYLAHLLGIPHIVVAVNKMDLVDYSPETFARIRPTTWPSPPSWVSADVRFIPMSALHGDMIVDRGEHLDWYDGPTLLEILETAPAIHSAHAEKFRFPVQYVCRPQDSANPELHDYRGFMGRVESGELAIGDAVTVLPSGRETRVKDIQVLGESQPHAVAEQSVTILLDDEIDISRGDMIVKSGELPHGQQTDRRHALLAVGIAARPAPQVPASPYHARQQGDARRHRLPGRRQHLEQQAAERLVMNDIARVSFRLAQPIFADPYAESRGTGAFIVIDESSNNTVGAGMIV